MWCSTAACGAGGDAVQLVQQHFHLSMAGGGGASGTAAPVIVTMSPSASTALNLFYIPSALVRMKQQGPLIYIPLCLIGAAVGVWGMVRMKSALMMAKGNWLSFRWLSGFALLIFCQLLQCAGESIGPQAIAVSISTLTFVAFSQFAGPLLLRENFQWSSILNTGVLTVSITGIVVLGPQPVQAIALTGDHAKWGVLAALMVALTGLSFLAEWNKGPPMPTWADKDTDRRIKPTSRQKTSALCLLLCSSFITWFSKIMLKMVLAEGGLMTKGPEKCILAWILVAGALMFSALSTHLLNSAFVRWSLARLEPIFATNMIILMTLSGVCFLGDLGHLNVANTFQSVLLAVSVIMLFVGLFLCMSDAA